MARNRLSQFARLSKLSADEKQLKAIERLLGEDFESLAEARRELAKQSSPAKLPAKAPAVKPPAAKLPSARKKVYTISDFDPKKKIRVAEMFRDLEQNYLEIDKLKEPGELWALEIGNKKTHITHPTMRGVVEALKQSFSIRPHETKIQEYEFVNAVKILKLNPPGLNKYMDDYAKQKEKGAKKFIKVREAQERERQAIRLTKEAQERERVDKKRIADLEKQLKAATKKLTKKASKKRAK